MHYGQDKVSLHHLFKSVHIISVARTNKERARESNSDKANDRGRESDRESAVERVSYLWGSVCVTPRLHQVFSYSWGQLTHLTHSHLSPILPFTHLSSPSTQSPGSLGSRTGDGRLKTYTHTYIFSVFSVYFLALFLISPWMVHLHVWKVGCSLIR